jgi:hypothetical protein
MQVILLSLSVMPMIAISGRSRLLKARLCIGTCRRCRVAEEGLFPLGRGESPCIIEMNASAKSILSFEAPSTTLACKN